MISDLDVGQQITYPAYPEHIHQRLLVNNMNKTYLNDEFSASMHLFIQLLHYLIKYLCISPFKSLSIAFLVEKVNSVCLALVVGLPLLTLKRG